MSASPIDTGVLRSLVSSTDADFVAGLLATFLEDSPGLISDVRSALAEGDAPALRRAAHSLKSSSASLGAAGLSEMARELEMMAKAENLNGAAARVEALTAEYGRVERARKEWQHEP